VTGEDALLGRAYALGEDYRRGLRERFVGARADAEQLRTSLAATLSDEGMDPVSVLEALACAVEPGLSATAGPRWFGFVDGGSLPVALAADWLTAAWDQNAGLAVGSPAAAIVEEVVAGWVLQLLGLPVEASVGFVTGGQMANFTCLAAARGELLRRAGWDVYEHGLWNAPQLRVLVGDQAHATIFSALRMLGIGSGGAQPIDADAQGAMRPEVLARVLAQSEAPTLVCISAGNVNSGAFDPFGPIADAAAVHGACWLHVDGAFGLWAAASPRYRHLLAGVERADSWAVDGHKWLNVPYDSGIAVVRHRDAHRAAMAVRAPYLVRTEAGRGDGAEYVPEASRRARGFVLYATLRSLGREGVARMIERCCAHAQHFAELLGAADGVEVLNDIVLNQVLLRFPDGSAEASDARTRAVIERVQRGGTCWVGGTTWEGRAAMRISVVNWSTEDQDVTRSAAAILDAAATDGRRKHSDR
jgi:glutamate/tyrosine decarboxylase-like PLP-dependent enzyme